MSGREVRGFLGTVLNEDVNCHYGGVALDKGKRPRKRHPWACFGTDDRGARLGSGEDRTRQVLQNEFCGWLPATSRRQSIEKRLQVRQVLSLLRNRHGTDELTDCRHTRFARYLEGQGPEARSACLLFAPHFAERQRQARPQHQRERRLLGQSADQIRGVSAAPENQAGDGVVEQDMVREQERVFVVPVLVLSPQNVVLLKVNDGRRIGLGQYVGSIGLKRLRSQHAIDDSAEGEFAPIMVAIGAPNPMLPVGVEQFGLGRDCRELACHNPIFHQFGEQPKVEDVAEQGA